MGENLSGSHWIRIFLPAVQDAQRLWSRTKDRMAVRRHALKLRFWPKPSPTSETGEVLDLDWSWIRAMKGVNVGELRIDDEIGDCDNIRLIFYVHNEKRANDPRPIIWTLAAMHKKRNDFTVANFKTFQARYQLVPSRLYGG